MKQGFLSQYFDGVVAKRLSAVEADTNTSNQHEMNGVVEMKRIFGAERIKFPATFIHLNDTDPPLKEDEVFLTWYDARENHPTRTEYRLYFPSNPVTERFEEGDLIVLARRPDGSVVLLTAKRGSTAENQMLWLFGLPHDLAGKFEVRDMSKDDARLGLGSKMLIEELGIEIEESADDFLGTMLDTFGSDFPATKVFSEFARVTFGDADVSDDPDGILVAWIEHEEKLFRTLERHFVAQRIKKGWGANNDDVDEFISYSLSVQNRRKSRMGHALENHLEHIFQTMGIDHSRGATTEGKKKPDFLFPSAKSYHDSKFPVDKLTMLASKSTCKDRWRQVLSEAKRIKEKHLITLEPGITTDQTNEMKDSRLQLVVPKSIQPSYTAPQQKWLVDFQGFIALLRERG